MSKDAMAGVYAQMLDDEGYKDSVAADPGVLNDWDLTQEEKDVLLEEARAEVAGFAIGSGPVMSRLSSIGGAPLSPPVASSLGSALNRSAGLPVGALDGPGFLSNAACCPWNSPSMPGISRTQ